MATSSANHADLDRIQTKFLQMCVRAESMVRLALRAVMERDPPLARSVIASDAVLDRLEVDIDGLCMSHLARHHPVGRDLRTITTTMKMVTDLERIGDLAVNIAERSLDLASGTGIEPGLDVARMGEIAADMLRAAADAFLDGDSDGARAVIARDVEVDELNRQALERWLAAMVAHPDQVDRGLSLTSTSKYLERIADHACNLGEMVIFLVDGDDVRHSS